ncbi:hypothetical protein GCM10022244_32430 [Streptomyces gulbargensis]|uniref:Uncharacterized protein n=1 Tax=Streptomyces gulbargensis TaxID=364901 RepID=A0ABP7MDU8_9ACTN
MVRQDGRPGHRGFGLLERETALEAAEEALDLLTGARPERVPAPRGAARAPHLVVHHGGAHPVPRPPAEGRPGGGAPAPGPRPVPLADPTVPVPRPPAEGTPAPAARPETPEATPERRRRGGILRYEAAPGLGRTALLAEIRRRAATRGCVVLAARGTGSSGSGPYATARHLLLTPPDAGIPEDGPGAAREQLDRSLARLAGHRPLVLVLDDAHAADPESLGWLTACAERAADLPVLIVLAHRAGALPEAAAGLVGRPAHRLDPLGPAALARLVRERVGTHADDVFCRSFRALTGGNPAEAVALAAAVRDHGLDPTADSARALRDLAAAVTATGLVARLESLGPTAVRLAWACAVLGTEAPPRLAGAVAGLGGETVAECARRLREARVLAEADGPDAPLAFGHPLLAATVYDAVPAATRVALHGQAAWCVAEAGLGSTATARHLLETHPEGDPWVVGHLRAAAREHLRDGAPEAAARSLARALREPPAADERDDVLAELDRATRLARDVDGAGNGTGPDRAAHRDAGHRLSPVLADRDRLARAADLLARKARPAAPPRDGSGDDGP